MMYAAVASQVKHLFTADKIEHTGQRRRPADTLPSDVPPTKSQLPIAQVRHHLVRRWEPHPGPANARAKRGLRGVQGSGQLSGEDAAF